MGKIVLELKNASVSNAGRLVLDRVSFSVKEGDIYVLLGREGAGKSFVVRCALGKQKPSSGEVFLFGENPLKHRSESMRRVGVISGPPGERALAAALAKEPELLVLDGPIVASDAGGRQAFSEHLRGKLAEKQTTVFLTARDPAGIEGIASHIGILKAGRLRVDEGMEALRSRVRKITYRNEMTESRTDYGSELDEFDAVSVRVRGWGIDAIVRDYDENKFERFRVRDGVADAAAAPVSLEELFLAVAGETNRSGETR